MKKKIICVFFVLSFGLTACVSQKDYDAIVEEKEDLVKQVKDLKNENDDLFDQIEDLKAEKDELSDQITVFQSDIAELKARMEGLESNANDDSNTTTNSIENVDLGSIIPMDPPSGNKLSGNLGNFHDVKIRLNGYEVMAYTNDTFYVLYAKSAEGNTGWYLYDSAEGRWIRYAGILTDANIVSDPTDITYYVAERYYRSPQRTGEDEESESIIPLDPPANENEELMLPYLSEEFHNVKIRINGYEVSAFTDDIFYVFYAKSPEGNYGWYIYDSLEGRWLRFVFDFENN